MDDSFTQDAGYMEEYVVSDVVAETGQEGRSEGVAIAFSLFWFSHLEFVIGPLIWKQHFTYSM